MTGLSPAGLGYCKYSMTHSRPRSSKLAVTGWRTIGSAAKTSTWNPSRDHHPPDRLLRSEPAGLASVRVTRQHKERGRSPNAQSRPESTHQTSGNGSGCFCQLPNADAE